MGAILAGGWYSGYVGYVGQRDHYGRNLRFPAADAARDTHGPRVVSRRGATAPQAS